MIKTIQAIDCDDWDNLVVETYGRPYCLQQQNGCMERGTMHLSVPSEWTDDYEAETIPEKVNGEEMGVSFAAWLARDPEQQLPSDRQPWSLELFWHRNFYPNMEMVANDLHAKGLLPAGEYTIIIDW